MPSIEVTLRVDAPREVVFDTATDHEAYPRFTALRKQVLEREGSPERNGVGAIRRGTVVGPPVREEVLAFERPERFQYRLLSGLPLRDHLGTITLTDNDDGTTTMHYACSNRSPVRGGDAIAKVATKKVIGDLAKGIKKESEARAARA